MPSAPWLQALETHLWSVALCSARFLPAAFMSPIFGGATAPGVVRLGALLSIGAVLHFAGGLRAPDVQSGWELLAMAARELTFGMAIGLVASLPFDAARMGGRIVDLVRGSSAEASLPLVGSRESASGELLYQLTISLAALGGGLAWVIRAIGTSFTVVQLGTPVATEAAALHVVQLAGAALGTGLAIGAPVAALSLAVDAAVAFATRAGSGANLQELAAPLRILGGGLVLWLAVGIISERLLGGIDGLEGAIHQLARQVR